MRPGSDTGMSRRPVARQVYGLVGWAIVTFATAAIGAAASVDAAAFYGTLARPTWAPPSWLFGPVWSVLYALMAIAAWMVWRLHGFQGGRRALVLFIVQLAFNALWSWLFFQWHQGALAFAEVVLLWSLIVATVLSFWKLSRVAAALMIPYLAWVTFASALTFAVWRLNPSVL